MRDLSTLNIFLFFFYSGEFCDCLIKHICTVDKLVVKHSGILLQDLTPLIAIFILMVLGI